MEGASESIMLTGKEDLIQSLIGSALMQKGTMDFPTMLQRRQTMMPENGLEKLSQWEHKHMDFIGYLYQSIHEDKDG